MSFLDEMPTKDIWTITMEQQQSLDSLDAPITELIAEDLAAITTIDQDRVVEILMELGLIDEKDYAQFSAARTAIARLKLRDDLDETVVSAAEDVANQLEVGAGWDNIKIWLFDYRRKVSSEQVKRGIELVEAERGGADSLLHDPLLVKLQEQISAIDKRIILGR